MRNVSVNKLFRKDEKCCITEEGDYSNNRWLIKGKFCNDKLKEGVKKHECYQNTNGERLWKSSKAKELIPRHVFVLRSEHTVREITDTLDARLYVNADRQVYLNRDYIDYLSSIIPDFNLRICANWDINIPVVIYSSERIAGLVMACRV